MTITPERRGIVHLGGVGGEEQDLRECAKGLLPSFGIEDHQRSVLVDRQLKLGAGRRKGFHRGAPGWRRADQSGDAPIKAQVGVAVVLSDADGEKGRVCESHAAHPSAAGLRKALRLVPPPRST